MRENNTDRRFGGLFWSNAFFFLAAGLLMLSGILLPDISRNSIYAAIFAALTVFIALPLFGLNLAAVLLSFTQIDFSRVEKTAIASVLSLLGSPLLLSLEYSIFGGTFPGLPLLNSAALFLIAIRANPDFLEGFRLSRIPRAALWACSAYAAIIAGTVFAYFPLPDYDPYYWVPTLSILFADDALTPFGLSRPLFSALVYIFDVSAGIDIYFVFKYLLPLLVISAIPPLFLVSLSGKEKGSDYIPLLLPFAGGSFLLYTLAPIPQGVANVLFVSYAAFLLHAWQSGRRFFFLASGPIIFLTYFYHETAIIGFAAWLFVTIVSFRREIQRVLRERWIIGLVVLLLLAGASKMLYPLLTLISYWLSTFFSQIFPVRPNFRFPFSYVNIDGNEVGWGSAAGVAKYYLFYAGPAAIAAAAAFFIYAKREGLRGLKSYLISREMAALTLAFTFYFLLSDILPRVFSFALLPERALGMASFFLVAVALPLLRIANERWAAILRVLFILGILLNIAAALYINYQKKYLIPPSQVDSAEWITTHLPSDRLFLSDGHVNLLQVHSRSGYVNVEKQDFYRDASVFDMLVKCLERGRTRDAANETECARFMRQSYPPLEILRSRNLPHLYVYYARDDKRNPYRARPYFAPDLRPDQSQFVFDLDPRFRRIYALPGDEIVIWEYLR